MLERLDRGLKACNRSPCRRLILADKKRAQPHDVGGCRP